MKVPDYKAFIEDNFLIKNKKGEMQRFILNNTQSFYLDQLYKDYPTMQGIRENDLKFRQPGFSSLIDAIFAVDFILSESGLMPIVDCDIVSHKEKETKVLYERAQLFIDSYLAKNGKSRSQLLDYDTVGYIKGKRGSQMYVQTASARVSGRGGTKQNIHWSEVAFYSNTEIINARSLVTGAEQQVADGVGKIFRESTGNIADDFFATEYEAGKKGKTEFRSRFFGWWIHNEYRRELEDNWTPPSYYTKLIEQGTTLEQCFWHYKKTDGLLDEEKMREYPTYDSEAFLLGGSPYFNRDILIHYTNMVKKPVKEIVYVSDL